ncbi:MULTISPECIES: hypothetical protein [unclassified Microbacterium]|uniref:hypothetical protein n=1 Tax=unclassified Microbacterium TaxID=2609290 RepID=UPI002005BCC1|nr:MULTISPECIES: hypothetical protein [unclassified Microbacterium]
MTSGAFFTRASLWISLLIAVTVMAPFQHFADAGDHVWVLTVGLLGWAVLASALVPVAIAERRMRNRTARGALVIGAVAIAAIARPFVNEGFFVALFGVAPDFVGLPARISSNLVVWIAGLSIIAITVRSIALTRGTRGRLADAIATLTAGQQRLARYEGENRDTLACLIADLREQREAMLAGTIDFAAVRDYSETVRSASHRLEERSKFDLRVAAVQTESGPDTAARRSVLAMLRPPPYLLVGLVFMAGAVPYAHGVGGLTTALWAVAVGVPITLAADLATRLLARGRSAARRGAVIVAAWVAAGILMTVLADALVASDDPSRFVPLVSVPIVAIALAACTDAIARAAVSAQRLEAVLALVARTLTAKTARARRPLRNAAHVLHGRVQGRCVLLAAAADEWELTEKDVETFRRDTDAAFDGIIAFIAETDAASLEHLVQSAHEDLSELVATWSAVLEVSSEISPAAADALVDPELSRNVATVVNEGFVNAVKHSEAKAVWLSIGVEADALLVRTWSTGTLDRAPVLGTETRGISVLGIGARIFQRAESVVLEVPVPLRETQPDVAPIARLPRRAWWGRRAPGHSQAG